jgi:hypothetical protein
MITRGDILALIVILAFIVGWIVSARRIKATRKKR